MNYYSNKDVSVLYLKLNYNVFQCKNVKLENYHLIV